jgi:hypothetical protein
MIVMTMAMTASVNASSRPFVTVRASHTALPLTEDRYDQDDLRPGPRNAGSVAIDNRIGPDGFTRSWALPITGSRLLTAREASGRDGHALRVHRGGNGLTRSPMAAGDRFRRASTVVGV